MAMYLGPELRVLATNYMEQKHSQKHVQKPMQKHVQKLMHNFVLHQIVIRL